MNPYTSEFYEQLVADVAERVLARLGNFADSRTPETAASPYMTVPEAAEYLRSRRHRVDDLLSQRRLTRFKDGTRTLVSRAELEAYVAAQSSGVAPTLPRRSQARTGSGTAA